MKSYLSGWSSLVETQRFQSSTTNKLPCSIIQGSKLSSLFHTLFTGKVVHLARIMNDPQMYEQITEKRIRKYSNIRHTTINYADDSTNMIVGNNHHSQTVHTGIYIPSRGILQNKQTANKFINNSIHVYDQRE